MGKPVKVERGIEEGGKLPQSETPTGETLVKLRKEIGLPEAVSISVGSMIGSGIFITPREVLHHLGSVGLCLVSWVAGGVMSGIGAWVYAEMGTTFPGSGGDYYYLYECFGDLPAFLLLWVSVFIFLPAAVAILAISFAQYVTSPFFPQNDPPDAAVKLLAAVVVIFFTWVNCYSMRLATKVQNAFMVGKTLAVALIVLTGMVNLYMGRTGNFEHIWENTSTDPGTIALAFYSTTFTYEGWNGLNYVVEELKNPNRNLPLGILISVPLVTFIYLMVNIAYFTMLTPVEILENDAIANSFGGKIATWMGTTLMPLLVAMSSLGCLSVHIMTNARVIFAGGRNKHIPAVLSLITTSGMTPTPALMFLCGVTLIYMAVPELRHIIELYSFVYHLVTFAVTVGLLHLRWKQPDLPRPLKVSLFFPIAFIFICLFLIIAPLYVDPVKQLFAMTVLLTGLPVYYLFIKSREDRPQPVNNITKAVTILVQKILLSAEEDSDVYLKEK